MIGRPHYSQNYISNIYLFDYFLNYVIIILTFNVKNSKFSCDFNLFE